MSGKPDILDRTQGCLNRLGNILLLLFLNLVWVGLFLWGNYYFKQSRHLSQNGVEVAAVVVANLRSVGEDGEYFTPLFEYTYGGQVYSVEGNVASYPARYNLGESETLLVDPDNPARAGSGKWVDLWGATAGLWSGAAFGALVTNGAGLGSLLRQRRT